MSHVFAWAVFFVPQDVICELICDHRFPDDTLFMIFEEDYRFWPVGEDPDQCDDYAERLRKLMKASRNKSGAYRPDDEGFEDPAAAGAKGEAAKGRAKGFRQSGDLHFTDQRAPTIPREQNEGLKQEVADLIRIATMCNRRRCGDIIWFGWECHAGDKPTWLWKGSHGIMLSKRGAHHIECAMRSGAIARDHIDLALVWWLRRPMIAEKAGACYIYPPLGAYFEHASGCDPKNFGEDKGGRPDGWSGALNPARGTRKSTDQSHRTKYVVQWKGTGKKNMERTWIEFPKDEVLHSPEYLWLTYKEEPTASLPPPPPPPPEPGAKKEEEEEETVIPVKKSAKPKLTNRQRRNKHYWNVWQKHRHYTKVVEQAAPPITLF